MLGFARKKPPFGIAQVGKSFRNEITPGNFIFRTREFEQMEMEFFVPPAEAERWYREWIEMRERWYTELGLRPDHLRVRAHDADELSHYSSATSDVEYLFPIGWSELEGIANRGDFDLTQHAKFSGEKLEYFDQQTKERYVPHVIEPAAGADRATLAFLVDSYEVEEVEGRQRTVLRLHPRLAPVKVAVLPLVSKEGMPEKAREIFADLRRRLPAEFDEGGSIGKRYRRQDEIGTPWGVTVDHQTMEDDTVTLRDRDSLEQVRVPIEGLGDELVAPPRSSPGAAPSWAEQLRGAAGTLRSALDSAASEMLSVWSEPFCVTIDEALRCRRIRSRRRSPRCCDPRVPPCREIALTARDRGQSRAGLRGAQRARAQLTAIDDQVAGAAASASPSAWRTCDTWPTRRVERPACGDQASVERASGRPCCDPSRTEDRWPTR